METEYRGWRIVEVDVDQECHGFQMQRAFRVMDEFDDLLPVLQSDFWSPSDAQQAVDFVIDAFELTKGKKWPTTKQYEFNVAIAYRARFVEVYTALVKIDKLIEDAEEMGDDPGPAIREHLGRLRTRCLGRS